LAPVEQSIQGWRNLSKAKESYANLDLFLHVQEARETVTTLPEPSGHLMLQNVFAIPAIDGKGEQGEEPLIRNVSLALQPGQVLGIAGASGSGKSTLVRLMAGVILPMRGTVRVDGAELTRSLQTQFSQYIGYLPQDVELFDGTIAENIARFSDASDEAIVRAAQLAGAHELILSLKEGYQTQVGPGGRNLSGGQRQRVGLARALFGSPKLVFLDEPTSNLDEPGTMALLNAVQQLKKEGMTIVLIAHQPRLFLLTDLLAVMKQGVLETLGPTREVLEALRTTQTDVAKQSKSSVLYSAQMKTADGESPKERQEGHE
jgi:ABC-type protease/lipase transport system fused ATPase/permease subunit